MRQWLTELKNSFIERIASEQINEQFKLGYDYGLSQGRYNGSNNALHEIRELLEKNTDIKVIADGHRANKTKTATATADGLEIGYQYAIGLLPKPESSGFILGDRCSCK